MSKFELAVIPAVVSAVIVVLAMVPPSTLSPDIWLSASVSVPAETSKVFDDPTVIFDVAIVAPSIFPESIFTFVVAWLLKFTGKQAATGDHHQDHQCWDCLLQCYQIHF